MTQPPAVPPAEHDGHHERRAAAEGRILRFLICYSIFQAIMAAHVVQYLQAGSWSAGHAAELGGSACTALMTLFAGLAGLTSLRHRSALPRRWLVLGLGPWLLLAGQGTALLVSTRL